MKKLKQLIVNNYDKFFNNEDSLRKVVISKKSIESKIITINKFKNYDALECVLIAVKDIELLYNIAKDHESHKIRWAAIKKNQ